MEKFIPSQEYSGLLRQAYALHTLLTGHEKELAILRKRDYDTSEVVIKRLESELESEREMNESMTNELEGLDPKRMNARLRKDILEGLTTFFENQERIFRKMYDPEEKYENIEDVVRHIMPRKLKWAYTQVESTMLKNVRTL